MSVVCFQVEVPAKA